MCRHSELLTVLGPSFIKAGQVLANRPDIVREDYMNELCILQVRVCVVVCLWVNRAALVVAVPAALAAVTALCVWQYDRTSHLKGWGKGCGGATKRWSVHIFVAARPSPSRAFPTPSLPLLPRTTCPPSPTPWRSPSWRSSWAGPWSRCSPPSASGQWRQPAWGRWGVGKGGEVPTWVGPSACLEPWNRGGVYQGLECCGYTELSDKPSARLVGSSG